MCNEYMASTTYTTAITSAIRQQRSSVEHGGHDDYTYQLTVQYTARLHTCINTYINTYINACNNTCNNSNIIHVCTSAHVPIMAWLQMAAAILKVEVEVIGPC
jgi:hypothetical protein